MEQHCPRYPSGLLRNILRGSIFCLYRKTEHFLKQTQLQICPIKYNCSAYFNTIVNLGHKYNVRTTSHGYVRFMFVNRLFFGFVSVTHRERQVKWHSTWTLYSIVPNSVGQPTSLVSTGAQSPFNKLFYTARFVQRSKDRNIITKKGYTMEISQVWPNTSNYNERLSK